MRGTVDVEKGADGGLQIPQLTGWWKETNKKSGKTREDCVI